MITDECLIPKGRLTKNRGERISKSPLDHRPADMTSSPRSVPEAYHLIQQSGPDPSCRHDRRHWTGGIPKQASLLPTLVSVLCTSLPLSSVSCQAHLSRTWPAINGPSS